MPDNTNQKINELHHADSSVYPNKNKENKPKKPNKKKSAKEIMMMRVWDVILLVLFLITSCFLSYVIYRFHIIPDAWLYTMLAVMTVFFLIFTAIIYLKSPNWLIWCSRALLVILCCGLSYGCVLAANAYNTLEAITSPETTTTINISVISLNDGEVKKIEDLNGKKIGIQNISDETNSSFAREQLEKEEAFENAEYVEGQDYTDLYKQLKEGNIDALIITNSYISLLENTYPEIQSEIHVVAVYQKERESVSNDTGKDIRYDPFTVFIYGMEDMGDVNVDQHNDVNMLLFINPRTNQIQMVSFPRDAYVPNPALGYANDKLTHTGMSGVQNAELAIENVLGIEIDYYAKVNFASMIEIVDTIGGIEVDVELSFCEQDENRSFGANDIICLEPGVQHLNGKQALAYSRHRKTEGYGDIGRTRAQQRIIQGIVNKLLTTEGISSLNSLMKVAQTKVLTNMPMEQITKFISYELDRIRPWTMNSMTIDSYGDMLITASFGSSLELSCQVLVRESAQEALKRLSQLQSQMKMNEFHFDLENLEYEVLTLPNNGVVWAGSDISNYKASVPQEEPDDESEAPIQPDVPTVDDPVEENPGGSGNGDNTENPGGGDSDNKDPVQPDPPVTPPTEGGDTTVTP